MRPVCSIRSWFQMPFIYSSVQVWPLARSTMLNGCVFSTDSLAGPLTRPFCPPSAGQHQRVAGFPVSPTRGVAAQGPLFICSARTELTGQCSFQGCNRLNVDTCAWMVKLSQEKSIKSKCICTSNSIQWALTRLHLTLGWQRFLWRKRCLIIQVLYELLYSLRLVPTLGTNISDYLNRKSGFSEKLQPCLVSFRLLRPPWTNCSHNNTNDNSIL